MLSIRDGEALDRALRSDIDHRIKALLRLRRRQLGGDIADQAHFAIVQPGDRPADLKKVIGFSVFRNAADGSLYGEPDWQPGWEWIEDHGFAYELCYVMDDSGFAHVIVIPKCEAMGGKLTLAHHSRSTPSPDHQCVQKKEHDEAASPVAPQKIGQPCPASFHKNEVQPVHFHAASMTGMADVGNGWKANGRNGWKADIRATPKPARLWPAHFVIVRLPFANAAGGL